MSKSGSKKNDLNSIAGKVLNLFLAGIAAIATFYLQDAGVAIGKAKNAVSKEEVREMLRIDSPLYSGFSVAKPMIDDHIKRSDENRKEQEKINKEILRSLSDLRSDLSLIKGRLGVKSK